SATSDAKVDTSAPGAPSLTLSESSSLEYATGTTLYYNPQGSNSASFDVTATSSDTESGIASIAFPTVFGSDSLTDSTSPYSQTYSWTASASASGSKTVTATNGAGSTTTSTFTVTPDTTAPSGQTIVLGGGTYYTTLSIPLTLGNGTDSGSGIDASSGIVERDSATLSGGSCGSF